jgi:hypothetical protein
LATLFAGGVDYVGEAIKPVPARDELRARLGQANRELIRLSPASS